MPVSLVLYLEAMERLKPSGFVNNRLGQCVGMGLRLLLLLLQKELMAGVGISEANNSWLERGFPRGSIKVTDVGVYIQIVFSNNVLRDQRDNFVRLRGTQLRQRPALTLLRAGYSCSCSCSCSCPWGYLRNGAVVELVLGGAKRLTGGDWFR